jgi:hypothetical protein
MEPFSIRYGFTPASAASKPRSGLNCYVYYLLTANAALHNVAGAIAPTLSENCVLLATRRKWLAKSCYCASFQITACPTFMHLFSTSKLITGDP